jgi:trehalose 6-phosphate phosphatase
VQGNLLVALDFDGTLAPITDDRRAAEMRASTRALLHAVAARVPVVVLSGRARGDVARRLAGVPLVAIVGNHGGEIDDDARVAHGMRRARAALARALAGQAGVEIEDKGLSLSVHYRHAPRPAVARVAIERAVARVASDLAIVDGKRVVNLVPRGAPDKGDALAQLVRTHRKDAAIFVGDDVTDEAVFTRAFDVPVLGVRVGKSGKTSADYTLARQRDIDRLLALIRDFADGRPAARSHASSDVDLPPALELLESLWRVNHALERVSAHMERTLGVTAQQRMILRCIATTRAPSAGDLARRLHLDKGTVSVALARLEVKGLVTRTVDPDDARRRTIALTARGRELNVPLRGTVERAVVTLLANAARSRVKTTRAVLAELVVALDAEVGVSSRDRTKGTRPLRRSASP